jgi:penicillin-binding protein 1C
MLIRQVKKWKFIKRLSKRQRRWLIAGILFFAGFLLLPSSFDEEPSSTVIESADGYLLGAKIAADGQWRFPAIGALPDKYTKALVAFEDRRFYYHLGVDPISITRALWVNIRKGKVVEGGSTISMQVVRLMRKGKSRTVVEKMIEAVLALRLEFRYSKKEILALYARHAPFGGNVVGIDAAAWRYFGRPATDLSWAEAAMLAVLPNTPSLIHPGRNRERLLNKRYALLRQLCAKGYFSTDDLPLYCEEPLPDKPLPLPADAPHLLERLAQTNAGENIRTTIRYHLQQRAVDVVNRHAMQQSGNNVNNMAAIILENETGRVLAYVGNVTDRANNEQGEKVDIITAPRSTGSILKPFLYAAMLDEGALLLSMLLPDIPIYINGFVPQNYSKSFDGAVGSLLLYIGSSGKDIGRYSRRT